MNLKLIKRLCFLFLISLFFSCKSEKKNSLRSPNIIIIYTDDLGYGDVSAYKKGTLNTPNIDKLANEGIRFNNGYASSATCSPSRYALLTGTYPWRNSRAKIITGGSLIIDTTEGGRNPQGGTVSIDGGSKAPSQFRGLIYIIGNIIVY